MGREIIFIMGDFFRMGDFEKWEIFQNERFWEMRDFEKLWKEKKKKNSVTRSASLALALKNIM